VEPSCNGRKINPLTNFSAESFGGGRDRVDISLALSQGALGAAPAATASRVRRVCNDSEWTADKLASKTFGTGQRLALHSGLARAPSGETGPEVRPRPAAQRLGPARGLAQISENAESVNSTVAPALIGEDVIGTATFALVAEPGTKAAHGLAAVLAVTA
jgi:hypothetical protein